MDKISFIIPTNNTKEHIANMNNTSTLQENKKPEQKINNNNHYIQIAPNVYKFGNNINLEDDIYLLYSNACQLKTYNKILAIQMFKKCQKLITDSTKNEVKYEIFINLALLISDIEGSSDEVGNFYEEALKICPDRAEPYYYWSIYCNKKNNFEKAYELLKKALLLSYNDAVIKYPQTQLTAYDKYLYDELSVACYWLKKYDEAKLLLDEIIDQPDFNESKERISKNLELVKKEMENI